MEKIVRAIFNLDSDLYPMTVTGKNETGGSLENGAFVSVGALEDNELGRETYSLGKLKGEAGEIVGFVSSPNLMYDVRDDERDFICGENELIRTYLPNQTTVGTYALKHFENGSALVKGDKLCAKAGTTTLTKVSADEKVIAKVIEKTDFEGQESIVLQFIK